MTEQNALMVTGRRAVVAVLALALVATGCGSNTEARSPAIIDCVHAIRFDGVIYASQGNTRHAASRYESADVDECRDVGSGAPGPVFPEHPHQVTTWTFAGYPPEQVLGVRLTKHSFSVFVARSVPQHQGERIVRDLADSDK
jgi:hypothetical protein